MASTPENPHNLADRGLALFAEVTAGRKLTVLETTNLVEACRIADRLERLNALITGDENAWMYIKESRGDDSVIEVVVNDPMKEARLHAAALRSLLAPFEGAREEQPAGEVPDNVTSIKDSLPANLGGAAARSKRSAK